MGDCLVVGNRNIALERIHEGTKEPLWMKAWWMSKPYRKFDDDISERLITYKVERGYQGSSMIVSERDIIEFIYSLTEELKEKKEIRNIVSTGIQPDIDWYGREICKKIFKTNLHPYRVFCNELCSPLYRELMNDTKCQKELLSINGVIFDRHKPIENFIKNLISKRIDVQII